MVSKLKGNTRFAFIKRDWGIVLHAAMNFSASIFFDNEMFNLKFSNIKSLIMYFTKMQLFLRYNFSERYCNNFFCYVILQLAIENMKNVLYVT